MINTVQRKKIGGQADKNGRIYYKETAAGTNFGRNQQIKTALSLIQCLLVNRDSIVSIAKHGTVQ